MAVAPLSTWLYRSVAVAFIVYYIMSASSVHCARTTKTEVNCYNVTKQIVVNETTEEWCSYLGTFTCYWSSSCYCNVTREVAREHVTTVCEGSTELPGNRTTLANASQSAVSLSTTESYATELPHEISNTTIGQNTTATPVIGQNTTTSPVIGQNTPTSPVIGQDTTTSPPIGQNATSPLIGLNAASLPIGQNATTNPPIGQNATLNRPIGQNTASPPIGQNRTSPPIGQTATASPPIGQNTTSFPIGQNATVTPLIGQNTTTIAVTGSANSSLTVSTQNTTLNSSTKGSGSSTTTKQPQTSVDLSSTVTTSKVSRKRLFLPDSQVSKPDKDVIKQRGRSTSPTAGSTLIDDDGETASSKSEGGKGGRKLNDPEVASIAVISALVFSILLSLTVFLVQRRHRNLAAQKASHTQVVVVESGSGAGGYYPGESESFLPPAGEKRYIHVQAANREENVYEDGSSEPEKAELLQVNGKPAVSVTQVKPSSDSPAAKADSPPANSNNSRPPSYSPAAVSNPTDNSPAVDKEVSVEVDTPSSLVNKEAPSPAHSVQEVDSSGEAAPLPEKSATDESAEAAVSTSSLRLNISDDQSECGRASEP